MLLLVLSNIATANASLLITPTKIEFSQRDRSAKVSLVNTGKEAKTYKIFWREQYQAPDGSYKALTEEQTDFPIASSMLRYSPRQVTLAPGERQHVRIALRRPKELENGEYRSHLVFEALPNIKELQERRGKETGIKMYLNLAFSIPVIVRQGALDTKATLRKVELFNETINNKNYLAVDLDVLRSGLHSVVGNFKIYWQDQGSSTETEIAVLNKVAIYTERDSRVIKIRFNEHSMKDGVMRIEYLGVDNLQGVTLFDEKIIVSPHDYKKRIISK